MALILVVDDSQDDLILLSQFLKSLGHECRLASSGIDAMDLISVEKFHLVISDYEMEQGDGVWLMNALKNIEDAPPCIIVTSDRMKNEAFFLKNGARSLCYKPIIWHQLKLQIDRLLDA